MNKKLIFITTMALVLSACSDNDVATTSEPATPDKAKDSAGDATNATKDTTSDAVESAGGMAAESDSASSGADATRPEDMTIEEAQEYMDKEMEKLSGEIGQ